MTFIYDAPGYPACDPLAAFVDGPAPSFRELGDELIGVVSRSIAGRSAACTIPGLPAKERLALRLRIDVGTGPDAYTHSSTDKSGDVVLEGTARLRLASLNPCLAKAAGVPGGPAADDWEKALAAAPIWESDGAMGNLALTASTDESGVVISPAFDPVEMLITLRRRSREQPGYRNGGWTWSKQHPIPPLVLDSGGSRTPSLARRARSVLGVNARAAVEPVVRGRRVCAASEVWSAARGRTGDGLAYEPAFGDTPTQLKQRIGGREPISLAWLHIDDGSAPLSYEPSAGDFVLDRTRSLRPFVLGGTTAHFAAAIGAPVRCVSGALLPLVGTEWAGRKISGRTVLLAAGLTGPVTEASASQWPHQQGGADQADWPGIPRPGALQVLLSGGLALLEARVDVRARRADGSTYLLARRQSVCLIRDPADVQYVVAHGSESGAIAEGVPDLELGSIGPKAGQGSIPLCRVSMWLRACELDANAVPAKSNMRRQARAAIARETPDVPVDTRGNTIWRRRVGLVVLLACNLGHPLAQRTRETAENRYVRAVSPLARLASLFVNSRHAPFGAMAMLPSEWTNVRRWFVDQTPRALPIGLVGPGSMVHGPWTAAGFGSAVLPLLELEASGTGASAWRAARAWCWAVSATLLPRSYGVERPEDAVPALDSTEQLAPIVIAGGKMLAAALDGRATVEVATERQARFLEALHTLPIYDESAAALEALNKDSEVQPDGSLHEQNWRTLMQFCRQRRAILDAVAPGRGWLQLAAVAAWQRRARDLAEGGGKAGAP